MAHLHEPDKAENPHMIDVDNHESFMNLLDLEPESDEGNHEYKYVLTDLTSEQEDHLSVQMSYRVDEGQGQAFYALGIRDDGFPMGLTEERMDESLKNLQEIAESISAQICFVQKKEVPDRYKKNIPICHANDNSGRVRSMNIDIMEGRKPTRSKKSNKRREKLEQNQDPIPDEDQNKEPDVPVEVPVEVSQVEPQVEPQSTNPDHDPGLEDTHKFRMETKLFVANVLIRKAHKNHYLDLRIGVAGNVDAGKSTCIGVLTKGALDNGRGSARANVFNHKHELTSGRTSSVSQQIMGFNEEGQSVNDLMGKIRAPSWEDIVKNSTKVITFFDLAGHEKYLKTTINGLSTQKPDYCLVMIGGNMGMTHMTKEHIILCLTFKIPIIAIVTKIDLAPPHILEKTMSDLNDTLKKRGKATYVVKTPDDIVRMSQDVREGIVVPILQISNVSGLNVEMLKNFLNLLPKRNISSDLLKLPAKYLIGDNFTVKGAGTVVSGILVQGCVKVGDKLLLGPDGVNKFIETQIKSIHCKKMMVNEAHAGTNVCFSLRGVARKDLRKGMVMLAKDYVPRGTKEAAAKNKTELIRGWREFQAEIAILKNHSTCIRSGYAPMIHIDNARQAAQIIQIIDVRFHTKRGASSTEEIQTMPITADEEGNPVYQKGRLPRKKRTLASLRAGDRATVLFRFCYKPEFIEEGSRLIFREGTTRGIGQIKKIVR